MKLTKIEFNEKENPVKISVSMSIEEALWIAKVSGKQRGISPHNEIYSCLSGAFFNRFWDDGISEADEELSVEIPTIVYETQ